MAALGHQFKKPPRLLALAISGVLALGVTHAALAQFPPNVQLSTLNGTNGLMIDGEDAGDHSGWSVSTAGDVNGDGVDDLIIGAIHVNANGGDSGRSYVVFGSTSGLPATVQLSALDGTNGFKLDGEAGSDRSGRSVSAAGDINGDGIDDLIVGAAGADPNGTNSGRSYVVFGSTSAFPATIQLSALDGTNGFVLDGEAANDASGGSVSAAGDINGDGIDDLIIGASGADPNGGASGRSYVVFGSVSGFPATVQLSALDGTNGFKLDGEAGEFSGWSVSAAGDTNDDGFDDLIIGAPQANSNGAGSGRSYVVFGSASGFPATLQLSTLNGTNGFMLDGEEAGDRSGWSVSAAGDVNGDGISDLIVGALEAGINNTRTGCSYVVFGSASGFPATVQLSALDGTNGFRLDGEATNDDSGHSVAAAGDIDSDGIGDLIIGAPEADANGAHSGRSYVVFGRRGGFPAVVQLSALDGTNGFRLDGETAGDRSGRSVSAAGDFNGDGFGDVIVGAASVDSNGASSGRTYVLFGMASPMLGLTPLATIDFGEVAIGAVAFELLTVENIGTGTLEPGAVSIQGINVGEYSIEMNNCAGAHLSNGETCGIEIGFAPSTPGIKRATLLLQSNAPTSPDSVELIGTNDVMFFDRFESG